jgi:hypothetical protein
LKNTTVEIPIQLTIEIAFLLKLDSVRGTFLKSTRKKSILDNDGYGSSRKDNLIAIVIKIICLAFAFPVGFFKNIVSLVAHNMKQKITIDQWRELSKEQQNCLIEWYIKREHDLSTIPYLTIGELIEFLGEDWVDYLFEDRQDIVCPIYEGELCDALWEAIKENLEELKLPKRAKESKYVFMARRINNGIYQYCLCERYLTEEEIMEIPDHKWRNEPGSKSNALVVRFVK